MVKVSCVGEKILLKLMRDICQSQNYTVIKPIIRTLQAKIITFTACKQTKQSRPFLR